MKLTDVAKLRLMNQQIIATKFSSAKNLVEWMGAMQAQDFNMAKWAVGLRLQSSTEATIEKEFDEGKIIRTHILRPTWHFVSADDIYWMLQLTAPRIKSSLKSRHKNLEVNEKTLLKSNSIIQKKLLEQKYATREELAAEFMKAKIKLDDNRLSHFMLCAELDGIICSGILKGNKQTYTLFNKRVLLNKLFDKEKALAALATKYFSSHAPATLQDFIWWSGLTVGEAKLAVQLIKEHFIEETINQQTYFIPAGFSLPKEKNPSVVLLPAFDEFIISYKDRTASIHSDHHQKAISQNGIFSPVIVINGEATGRWKRVMKKDIVTVETSFFRKHSKAELGLIGEAAEKFALFLNKRSNINFIE